MHNTKLPVMLTILLIALLGLVSPLPAKASGATTPPVKTNDTTTPRPASAELPPAELPKPEPFDSKLLCRIVSFRC